MRRTRRVAPEYALRLNQRDGQETERAEGGEKAGEKEAGAGGEGRVSALRGGSGERPHP